MDRAAIVVCPIIVVGDVILCGTPGLSPLFREKSNTEFWTGKLGRFYWQQESPFGSVAPCPAWPRPWASPIDRLRALAAPKSPERTGKPCAGPGVGFCRLLGAWLGKPLEVGLHPAVGPLRRTRLLATATPNGKVRKDVGSPH